MKVLLANPRGFCAGVNMAIECLEEAIRRVGPQIYVYHEIVHNKHVVDRFTKLGVKFVDAPDEVPHGSILLFSAHGVSPEIRRLARERSLQTVDATCPLVTKVHREAELHFRRGRQGILIGHAGHPEVIGTMGQLPDGAVYLIETVEEVDHLVVSDEQALAYVTQTTLSVDDTQAVVQALQARFPAIVGPHREDICYATTNRQEAVKRIAPLVEQFTALHHSLKKDTSSLCADALQSLLAKHPSQDQAASELEPSS